MKFLNTREVWEKTSSQEITEIKSEHRFPEV